MRRLFGVFAAALVFSLGAVAVIGRIGRDWEARVSVRGHSMEPTLDDGDWLLVNPAAFRRRAPRTGELVVARDPHDARRVLVKRVAAIGTDGSLTLAGDHPAHADDGSAIGAVAADLVIGQPWFRYWPTERIGKIA
ncbi:MAG: S26 family signal peptidase [Chloroflexota bacterium]